MKLKGISEDGIRRLARVVGQQEPDYGEGNDDGVKAVLEKADAKWTSEGWVVDGDLNISALDLIRLPKIKSVGGNFYCYDNRLTSLEGAPQSVGGNFWCEDNQLTSLEGAPQSVGGNFYCYDNRLTSLEGAPQSVGGNFYCDNNRLTSLEGCPQEVNGHFYCEDNPGNFTEEDVRAVCDVAGNVI